MSGALTLRPDTKGREVDVVAIWQGTGAAAENSAAARREEEHVLALIRVARCEPDTVRLPERKKQDPVVAILK